jgi:protein O-mannosyl-transferase
MSSWRPHVLPLTALAAVTAAVFGQCLTHEFLNWDDQHYVTLNPFVQAFTLDNVRAVFAQYFVGNYAPVQMLSYMADHALWGLRPGGFLFTNLLCHLTAGVLAYFLLLRIAKRRAVAFLGALLFLVHPVQVETVAWISQRKNLLAMVFFLASFHCYMSFRDARPSRGGRHLLASLAFFVLGALSKSVVVILPVVLVLYDLCIRRDPVSQSLRLHKLGYVAIAFTTAWLATESQLERPPELHGGSLWATLLTMVPISVRYLRMLVWPVDLSAIYFTPIRAQADVTFISSFLVLLVILAAALWLFRRGNSLAFWIAVFFVGLLPVSQLVPLVTLMNDRYLYFPMLGSAGFSATLVMALYDRAPLGWRGGVFALTGVVAVVLAVLTFQRTRVWHDSITLWSDALAKTPQKAVPAYYLGLAHLKAGDLSQALTYLHQAVDLTQQREKEPLVVLASLRLRLRQYAAAAPLLERLRQDHPSELKTWLIHGDYYCSLGDFDRCEDAYRRALQLVPGNPDGLTGLGRIHGLRQEWEEARALFLEALQNGGNNPEVLYELACVEAARGAYRDALGYLRAALRHGLAAPERINYDSRLKSLWAFPEFSELRARR